MVILVTGNTRDPQFEPHAIIKMAQVLGSLVYIYAVSTHDFITDVYYNCHDLKALSVLSLKYLHDMNGLLIVFCKCLASQ